MRKNPLVNDDGDVIGTVILKRSARKTPPRSDRLKKLQRSCVAAAWLLFVGCVIWGAFGTPYLRWDEPLHAGKDGEELSQDSRAFTNYVNFGDSRRVYAGEFGEGLPWLIFVPLGSDEKPATADAKPATFLPVDAVVEPPTPTLSVSEKPAGPIVVGIESTLAPHNRITWKVFDRFNSVVPPLDGELDGTSLRSGTDEVQRFVECFPGTAVTLQIRVPPHRSSSYLAIRHHMPHVFGHDETDRAWWWDHMELTTKRRIPLPPANSSRIFTIAINTLENVERGGTRP